MYVIFNGGVMDKIPDLPRPVLLQCKLSEMSVELKCLLKDCMENEREHSISEKLWQGDY